MRKLINSQLMKRDVLKSSLGDTYFYDFSEVLEMEIGLDNMAFTAEVKEEIYASSSFEEEVMTIRVLTEKGRKKMEIARVLGVTEGTVRYRLRHEAEGKEDGRRYYVTIILSGFSSAIFLNFFLLIPYILKIKNYPTNGRYLLPPSMHTASRLAWRRITSVS